MILWLNGAFGSGKTQTAQELRRRLPEAFIYDPENIGFFLRRNMPKRMQKPNFQDEPLWRAFNLAMLRELAKGYAGVLLVPMTLVNPAYYEEIIVALRREGVPVTHVVLGARRATL